MPSYQDARRQALNDQIKGAYEATHPEWRAFSRGKDAVVGMAVTVVMFAMIFAMRAWDAHDLKVNYTPVQATVLEVTGNCVVTPISLLGSTIKNQATRAMPCPAAVDLRNQGGKWSKAVISAHTDMTYQYLSTGDMRTHQAHVRQDIALETVPAVGSEIVVYVSRTDPTVSRLRESY